MFAGTVEVGSGDGSLVIDARRGRVAALRQINFNERVFLALIGKLARAAIG
jgi:hypothetical protein